MDSITQLMTTQMPIASQWSWLPTPASTLASDVDWLFHFLAWTCGGLFLVIVVPLIWFAVKYRRRHAGQKAISQKDHNAKLEILWSVLPVIYLTLLFHWGFLGYANIYTAPVNSTNLRVIGQKWNWTIQYPDEDISVSGQGSVIGVPLNQPIQLTMSSQDVIHSFFVPNFRVKQDVVPGRYTQLWFEANQVGEFPVFCTEYCGDQHSNMMAKIKVMPVAEYKEWVQKIKGASAGLSPLDLGKKLYVSKACSACHSVDGKPGIAPTFKGLYGHSVELQSGTSVMADDNYIRESILEPNAKIVKGFAPVMPTFKGQLSEADINGLIEFIKSLK